MFKQTYDSMNEHLVPEAHLVQATLEKMEHARTRRHRLARQPKRLVVAGLTAVLLIGMSLTAMAAAPYLSQFWESLTERYGQRIQTVAPTEPVSASPAADKTLENLRILAVATDRDNADVYFSLTDPDGQLKKEVLAVGELRVDGQAVPISASPVYYDGESGTAVFCQSIHVADGIEDSRANLSISAVYTRDTANNDPASSENAQSFSIALSELPLNQEPQTISYTMGTHEDALARSWEARYGTISQEGTITLLAPGEDQSIPGLEGAAISGAGYIDGKLHLQFHVQEPGRSALLQASAMCSDPDFEPNGGLYDDNAFDVLFQLTDGQVTDVFDPNMDNQSESIIDDKRGYEYVEVISSLPPEALPYWTWDFFLVRNDIVLEADWQQDFTLSSSGLSMRQNTGPFTVDVETLHLPENFHGTEFDSTWAPSTFDGLRVTPFGVTVSRPAAPADEAPENDGILKRFAPDVSKLEITVETADGTQTCVLDMGGYTVLPDEQNRMSARYLLEKPVEPEEILSLKVNGVEIPLTNTAQ